MKKSSKVVSSVLTGILLSSTLLVPFASANTGEELLQRERVNIDNLLVNKVSLVMNNAEMIEFLESEKEFFIDPTYADSMINSLKQEPVQGEYQTQGKLTLTAKAGAKALKAAMNKIGKKSWDASVKKIENNFGTSLVVFHWQSMSKLITVLSNSHTTISDAISGYLVNHGFNKTFANVLSRAFVAVFL